MRTRHTTKADGCEKLVYGRSAVCDDTHREIWSVSLWNSGVLCVVLCMDLNRLQWEPRTIAHCCILDYGIWYFMSSLLTSEPLWIKDEANVDVLKMHNGTQNSEMQKKTAKNKAHHTNQKNSKFYCERVNKTFPEYGTHGTDSHSTWNYWFNFYYTFILFNQYKQLFRLNSKKERVGNYHFNS